MRKDAACASGFTRHGYASTITAKEVDVLLDLIRSVATLLHYNALMSYPLQGHSLVMKS